MEQEQEKQQTNETKQRIVSALKELGGAALGGQRGGKEEEGVGVGNGMHGVGPGLREGARVYAFSGAGAGPGGRRPGCGSARAAGERAPPRGPAGQRSGLKLNSTTPVSAT